MPDDPKSKRHVVVESLSQPSRYDIPARLAREIGRFIVIWAHLEHYIQSVIWFQLKLTAAEGRIAVRDPRVTDRLDMIRDLGRLRNQQGNYVLLASIRQRCDLLVRYRHLLAHGNWTKTGSEWVVALARGSWNDSPYKDHPDAPTGSKAIVPESIPMTVERLREWTEQTKVLIADVRRLGDQHTEPPKPSPHKQTAQSRQRGQTQNRDKKGR